MKSGARPTHIDHRDYSDKTFGAIAPAKFPDEFNTDAGFGFPDQEAEDLPYGCTDETQAELANDIARNLAYSPFTLEAVTHANQRGGYGIRESLDAARNLGWIDAYFNIQPRQLDFFDSIRLAQMSGLAENRSVSIGTPWFTAWQGAHEILPTPDLQDFGGWHNWAIKGWVTKEGKPYLKLKSWQGRTIGFQYISREVLNSVMTKWGTAAFTATNMRHDNIERIDLTRFWTLWSYIYNLRFFSY